MLKGLFWFQGRGSASFDGLVVDRSILWVSRILDLQRAMSVWGFWPDLRGFRLWEHVTGPM